MKKRTTDPEPPSTRYANVDLDVYARVPLDAFVRALGDEALVLYVGGSGRKYEAHLELASSHMTMSPDDTVLGLIRLVRLLPRVHRTVWNSAQRREFNIGIEAGLQPHGTEFRLHERTLQAIADVRGDLVITVYAPDLSGTDVKRRTTRTRKRRLGRADRPRRRQ